MDQMAAATKLERWRNSAGEFIGLKRPSPRQPAEGSVLITYGNGSHAAGCAHYAAAIQSVAAFDVFILEYPGYADRPGSPSQRSLFQAADEAFQLLATNAPIFLLGESLGSGVAAYLAGEYSNRVAGVILLSPFNRLTDVAQNHMPLLPVRLLLVDRYPSADYLRNFHGPVGVWWTDATPWCRNNLACGFTMATPARNGSGNFRRADILKFGTAGEILEGSC